MLKMYEKYVSYTNTEMWQKLSPGRDLYGHIWGYDYWGPLHRLGGVGDREHNMFIVSVVFSHLFQHPACMKIIWGGEEERNGMVQPPLTNDSFGSNQEFLLIGQSDVYMIQYEDRIKAWKHRATDV